MNTLHSRLLTADLGLRSPLARNLLFTGILLAVSLPWQGAAAATQTWDGGPLGTGTNLNTPANWIGDTLPVAGDTARWVNGTALNLIYAGTTPDGAFGNAGISVNLAFEGAGAVTINSNPGTADGLTIRIRIQGMSVGVGAGAVTFGNSLKAMDWYLGTGSTSSTVNYTNDSSNAVTFGTNVGRITGGGFQSRNLTFGGSGGWNLANTSILDVTNFGTLQQQGAIAIIKNDGGTLVLGGSNVGSQAGRSTYSGAVTINGGTLQATTNTALGFGAALLQGTPVNGTTVNTSGTLDLVGNLLVNEAISLVNGGSLINSQVGTTAELDNGLAGIALTARGTGYTNGTAVALGGLLGNASATAYVGAGAGTAPAVSSLGSPYDNNPQNAAASGQTTQVINSITLTNAGNGYTSAQSWTITGGGGNATATTVLSALSLTGTTNKIGGVGNLKIDAVVSGSGGFEKIGAGTLTLTGTNTYTGGTTVSVGTLALTGTNRLASTGAVVVAGGTLDLGAAAQQVGAVTLSSGTISNGTLTGTSYSATNSGTVSAVLAGSGVGFTKTGAGSVTFTAVNTYTGNTLVSAGTLLLSGSGSIAGSPTVDVASGATLDHSGVSGGTYTFGSTQTLQGTGTVIGSSVVNGFLRPGNSPGVLSFTGALTLASSTESFFEIESGAPVRGTTYDGVTVSGLLSYEGTLTLDLTTLVSNSTYDLFAFGSVAGDFDLVEFNVGGAYTGTFTQSAGFWTATSNGQVFSFGLASGDLIVSAIPEPSTTLLLAGALTALVIFRRRRA